MQLYTQAYTISYPLKARKAAGSADLQDPRGLYDRGLSLALGEPSGLFPVGIDTSKPLPVLVKHGDLPVFVLAPPVFPELGAFSCGFGFRHGLNISIAVRPRKY